MPTNRPITQPNSSEAEVTSMVTTAPRSSWGQPAHTGEKSRSMVVGAADCVNLLIGVEPLLDDGGVGAISLEFGYRGVHSLGQLGCVFADGHAVLFGGELF